MFEFPPSYIPFEIKIYPNSTLEDIMEFLYQYHHLRIHGQGNTSLRKSPKDNEVYYKFLNKDSIKYFNILLVLHMESAITLDLRLPRKSEGYVREGFIDLLKPYSKKYGIFKSPVIATEDLFNDFDDVIKDNIHEQDVLFTDILVFGYRFTHLFFTLVAEEKGYEFHNTKDEERLKERIGNMIHNNPDYTGEISLHYNIEDYISKYHLDYPIIHDLYKNRFLDVKDVIFKGKEIEVVLHRFNNFPIILKQEGKTVIQNIHMEQNMHMQNISTNIDIDNSIQNINIANNENKTKLWTKDNDNNHKFMFNDKTHELIYGETIYKFRKDSMLSNILLLSFEREINEPVWHDEFSEKYGDIAKNQKEQSKELSTAISKYNKIFQEKFGKKDFFGRGKGYFYRKY